MTVEITGIAAQNLGLLKSQVWPLIDMAVSPVGESPGKVWSALEKGSAALVVAIETKGNSIVGACVTETLHKNKEKLLNVWCLAGFDMKNWIKHIKALEDWAYENAYDAVVIEKGRPGWQKILADRGYRLEAVYLRKKL